MIILEELEDEMQWNTSLSASENKLQDSLVAEIIEDLGLVQAMLEVKSEIHLNLQEALLELETV